MSQFGRKFCVIRESTKKNDLSQNRSKLIIKCQLRDQISIAETIFSRHTQIMILFNIALRAQKLTQFLNRLEIHLNSWRSRRLLLGATTIAFIALLSLNKAVSLLLLMALATFIGFVFCVRHTRKLERAMTQLNELILFYQRTSLRQQGEPSGKTCTFDLTRLTSAQNNLAMDLHLFGRHSIFGLLDETFSILGEEALAQRLFNDSADEIPRKQARIKSLAKVSHKLIRLLCIAKGSGRKLETSRLAKDLSLPLLGINTKRLIFAQIAAWIILLSVGIATSFATVKGFYLVYLLFSMWMLNHMSGIFSKGTGLSLQLESIVELLKILEQKHQPGAIQDLTQTIRQARISNGISKLNKSLAALSVDSNPIFTAFINAFIPWNCVWVLSIERARYQISAHFLEVFAELADFEVELSLALFARFQTSVFPIFASNSKLNNSVQLHFQKLFHPLLPRQQVIANSFAFTDSHQLGLLTGSNMAGKSTFLRTVGVNQVLAQMGAPVFAENLTTSFFKIESCIQVSDSLRDGFSYFYAEILRIKEILNQAKSETPTLVLIDEIFRGTNNDERRIGSEAILKNLLYPGVRGFVSTHDLELTRLATNEPRLYNLHFREHVEGTKMLFDYQLHHGPCPTTNALKLMRAAGLPVET